MNDVPDSSNVNRGPARIVPGASLARILDIAEDAIVTVDQSRRIVLFNRGAARMFGYEPEEILGRELEALLPERFHRTHPAQVDGFAHGKLDARVMGERNVVLGQRKDGSEFPAEVTISRIESENGALLTAIVRDATARKQYEEALVRLNQDLEERVRTRTLEVRSATQQLWQAARLAGVGELAASIAHELNNPLGTVSLRIEGLLARTPNDDPRRRPLEIVEQEVERMGNLVANLLQFSRPGRDQISTVNVCDEITKTIELTEPFMRRKQIVVEPDYHRDVPVIYADRQQLRQVFLNVFTNAGDAMPQGGRLSPRVLPGTLADQSPAVVIEIEDTGIGIPAEQLSRVTEPFFSTKEEGKGTGLGLAICRRIVQEHRGRLEIESEPGKGTRVRIVLPIRDATNVDTLRTKSTP